VPGETYPHCFATNLAVNYAQIKALAFKNPAWVLAKARSPAIWSQEKVFMILGIQELQKEVTDLGLLHRVKLLYKTNFTGEPRSITSLVLKFQAATPKPSSLFAAI
jgi:hypothetical protein